MYYMQFTKMTNQALFLIGRKAPQNFRDLLDNMQLSFLQTAEFVANHNTLSEHSPPTPLCSKKKITEWSEQNRIYCRDDCLKPELVEILKKLAPQPSFAVDEIARSCGHEVIRTPPYHPELQPIETCWGVVKNHIARHSDFTMKNLIEQLDAGFAKVTSKTCEEIIKKVRTIEDDFWTGDLQFDEQEIA